MKNSLLISSILLAGVGCASQPTELQQVQEEALAARTATALVDHVFVSKDTFAYTTYDYVPGQPHAVPRTVQVQLRLKFIAATDYTLDDQTAGLDYEVVVEKFIQSTGEVFNTDTTYFARKTGDVKHELFDCDSTKRCSTDSDTSRMYIFDTPHGKGMRLKNEGVWMIDTDKSELEFQTP